MCKAFVGSACLDSILWLDIPTSFSYQPSGDCAIFQHAPAHGSGQLRRWRWRRRRRRRRRCYLRRQTTTMRSHDTRAPLLRSSTDTASFTLIKISIQNTKKKLDFHPQTLLKLFTPSPYTSPSTFQVHWSKYT